VLWRMAIILKTNKINLFVSSVSFLFWYHLANFLDTPHRSVLDLTKILQTLSNCFEHSACTHIQYRVFIRCTSNIAAVYKTDYKYWNEKAWMQKKILQNFTNFILLSFTSIVYFVRMGCN
jgi:hypothetical protein